jgi:hypothetical protein
MNYPVLQKIQYKSKTMDSFYAFRELPLFLFSLRWNRNYIFVYSELLAPSQGSSLPTSHLCRDVNFLSFRSSFETTITALGT